MASMEFRFCWKVIYSHLLACVWNLEKTEMSFFAVITKT